MPRDVTCHITQTRRLFGGPSFRQVKTPMFSSEDIHARSTSYSGCLVALRVHAGSHRDRLVSTCSRLSIQDAPLILCSWRMEQRERRPLREQVRDHVEVRSGAEGSTGTAFQGGSLLPRVSRRCVCVFAFQVCTAEPFDGSEATSP